MSRTELQIRESMSHLRGMHYVKDQIERITRVLADKYECEHCGAERKDRHRCECGCPITLKECREQDGYCNSCINPEL